MGIPRNLSVVRRGLTILAAAAGLATLAILPAGGAVASTATLSAATAITAQPSASRVVRADAGATPLVRVGVVNLSAVAQVGRSVAGSWSPAQTEASRPIHTLAAPLRLPSGASLGPGPGVTGARVNARWAGNVRGEHGFNGLNSAVSGAANSGATGIGYVSPPGPALAVGPSPRGIAVLEFVNDALTIYTPGGKTLLGPVPAYKFFRMPKTALLSDPHAYQDGSGHWFATESVAPGVPNGGLSAIYLAVSQTPNPLGRWAIYRLDTSDRADTADGCPCFTNLAQLGGNGAGLYLSANQYSVADGHFTGTVIYAVKVYDLFHPARFSVPPPVRRYLVPAAADSFGAYALTPALTILGSSGNVAEYFVESNSSASTGSGLEIYALINPNGASGWPQLVETTVGTEPYSFPAPASQRHGPTPYGCSVHRCAAAKLDTNFDAVTQAMIAPPLLYAELTTGVRAGSGQHSGAAWFALKVLPQATSVAASLVNQGYVASPPNILDPVIGVNSSGSGYLAFAAANANRYPTAAYVNFDGTTGPAGPMRVAAKGADPLDEFTCYSKTPAGQCRYGDSSAATSWAGRIYLATEYVAPGRRDKVSNWSTRIWSAPVP